MSYRRSSRKRYSTRRMSRSRPRARRRTTRRLPRAVRGYVRTGGNYGRYQGSGGVELKYFDNGLQYKNTDVSGALPFEPATTGAVVELISDSVTGIAQGTAVNERIGNKIVLKSIMISGVSGIENVVSNVSGDIFRWWIVLDSQCNGVLPSFVDVFAFTSATTQLAVVTGALNPIRNLANSHRFKVLKSGTNIHAATAAISASAMAVPLKPFKCYMKVNIPIEYGSAGGTVPLTGLIGTVRANNVYLFIQTQVGYADTAFITRVRYADA